ncbi:MAG: hypothetical protein HQ511_14565, partial [Rhodospirillales bacterium]|nr:hypothetical protein [Rhodospirillales bacterium]
MPRNLSQEIEHRINLNRSQLNREVQQALTEMGGKLRPKAEAEANLRKNFENGFRDKKLAHAFCDDIYQGLNRRHGANANLNDAQNECTRQYRRYMWLDAEKRQDELVARLTAGQINLIGGSHFPKPAGNPDPIGWAISNSGPGEVLVDGKGCAVLHFNLPMAYDGSMAPHLAPGQPFVGTNKVKRTNRPFDPINFKKQILVFEGVKRRNAQGVLVGQSVDYMYMDTDLNVTVGFGHKISELADALSLNFVAVPPG